MSKLLDRLLGKEQVPGENRAVAGLVLIAFVTSAMLGFMHDSFFVWASAYILGVINISAGVIVGNILTVKLYEQGSNQEE